MANTGRPDPRPLGVHPSHALLRQSGPTSLALTQGEAFAEDPRVPDRLGQPLLASASSYNARPLMFGEPRPVMGSEPGAAEYSWLLPVVTSWKASAYAAGRLAMR
jgi:hypothetical protein